MDINRDAPATASAEAFIDAPPSVGGAVQSNLRAWPEWNPDVASLDLNGPLAPGNRVPLEVGRDPDPFDAPRGRAGAAYRVDGAGTARHSRRPYVVVRAGGQRHAGSDGGVVRGLARASLRRSDAEDARRGAHQKHGCVESRSRAAQEQGRGITRRCRPTRGVAARVGALRSFPPSPAQPRAASVHLSITHRCSWDAGWRCFGAFGESDAPLGLWVRIALPGAPPCPSVRRSTKTRSCGSAPPRRRPSSRLTRVASARRRDVRYGLDGAAVYERWKGESAAAASIHLDAMLHSRWRERGAVCSRSNPVGEPAAAGRRGAPAFSIRTGFGVYIASFEPHGVSPARLSRNLLARFSQTCTMSQIPSVPRGSYGSR